MATLFTAARRGNAEEVRRLINEGADVNVVKEEGGTWMMPGVDMTPLMVTTNLEVADALLTAGANVNFQNRNGQTALTGASGHRGTPEFVRRLIEAGADVNARTTDAQTPLIIASSWNNADIVQALLDAGADMNAQDQSGLTPLGIAAANGNTEVIRVLLRAGADLTDEQIRALPEAQRNAFVRERAAVKRGPLLALRYRGDNPQGGKKTRKSRKSRKSRKTRRRLR